MLRPHEDRPVTAPDDLVGGAHQPAEPRAVALIEALPDELPEAAQPHDRLVVIAAGLVVLADRAGRIERAQAATQGVGGATERRFDGAKLGLVAADVLV